jgi:hypothetical protein
MKFRLKLILTVALFAIFSQSNLRGQCILSGTYNNTGQFQDAINDAANAPNNCTTITLTGTASWSGDLVIPASATLVISGTGSITGNGTLTSTNNITIEAGGMLSLGASTTVTVNGGTPVPGGQTLNGPIVITSAGLPIELRSISAKQNNGLVEIRWSTASEIDNDHMAVERSGDGKNFRELGRVKGAGTTQTPQEYRFTDENPLRGVNYYRLRQVDFDGATDYSKVVSAIAGRQGNIRITPSPAVNDLAIQLETPAETAFYEVFDQAGRLALNGVIAPESVSETLDVTTLTAGFYVLRVTSDRQATTVKFQKN